MAKPQDNPTPKGYKKDGTPVNPNGKGGFRENPENRASGRWKKEYSASYQYNRWNNADVEDIERYAKAWGIIPLDDRDRADAELMAFVQANKKHTGVEERTLRGYLRAMTSLADSREIDNRTEGMPVAKQEIKIDNDLSNLTDDDLVKLSQPFTPPELDGDKADGNDTDPEPEA